MTTRIRLALAAAAALCSVAAWGALINVENAYETDTGSVRLPANTRGQLVIRECTGCKPVVMRVTPETLYLLAPSGEPVTLQLLREAVDAADDDDRLLTVFYSLESGFVTRVVLSRAG